MERWHIAVALGAMLTAYGLLAYVVLPAACTLLNFNFLLAGTTSTNPDLRSGP